MKIYKVSFNECDYDQYDAFVVQANSKKEAIELVKKEGHAIAINVINWEAGYKIEEIKPVKKARVILSSFNAG